MEDGLRLGADEYYATSDPDTFTKLAGTFDLILNTVSANLDIGDYLGLLATDGTLVELGAPEKPMVVPFFPLGAYRRNLSGSMIGGIPETQEMLDFCAEHDVTPEIEVVDAAYVNEAYERVLRVGRAVPLRHRYVDDLGVEVADAGQRPPPRPAWRPPGECSPGPRRVVRRP